MGEYADSPAKRGLSGSYCAASCFSAAIGTLHQPSKGTAQTAEGLFLISFVNIKHHMKNYVTYFMLTQALHGKIE